MERKALIIECSNVAGLDKLPGATIDASSWRDYLISARGGAWYNSEIVILRNPDKSMVINEVNSINSDYAFIAFSGHGYVSKETSLTMVCVNGGNLSESELTPSAQRSVVVMDSCRGALLESAMRSVASSLLSKGLNLYDDYRKIFDESVLSAEAGECKIYGCAFDQAAQESSAGGLFTKSFIETGENWRGRGALDIKSAFDNAYQLVRSRDKVQTPVFRGGRRLRHFPFAVNP